nr:hypothetical protein [Tanacetum cinerariifolium]
MSERSSRISLDHFCKTVMKFFGPEYMRKPTVTYVEKHYRHHEEKHWFSGMLGSLDCMDWELFGCPYGFKGQYVRRHHGPNPFILLEAVASQDLWIWHAFFGVVGSNNDINNDATFAGLSLASIPVVDQLDFVVMMVVGFDNILVGFVEDVEIIVEVVVVRIVVDFIYLVTYFTSYIGYQTGDIVRTRLSVENLR